MNLKNTFLCGLLGFSVSSFEGPHVILNCFKETNGHCVVAPNCNPSAWEPKAKKITRCRLSHIEKPVSKQNTAKEGGNWAYIHKIDFMCYYCYLALEVTRIMHCLC